MHMPIGFIKYSARGCAEGTSQPDGSVVGRRLHGRLALGAWMLGTGSAGKIQMQNWCLALAMVRVIQGGIEHNDTDAAHIGTPPGPRARMRHADRPIGAGGDFRRR